MISRYLEKIDNLLIAAEEIEDFHVIRRSLWDTDMETVCFYRYRVHFSDNSLLEITERIIEENSKIEIKKYRIHWQDQQGALIKRWDNANHHPTIETFPHHLHSGTEDNILPHEAICGYDAILLILSEIRQKWK